MTCKAIIADDEKELRTYLRSLLADVWPELAICGEAENGEEALALIRSERPQIAFLDIRMPGFSGMEVARELAGLCRIVFVTAYDRYAVEAFEREAVDYLLKPVMRDRLARTVQRLKSPPPALADQPPRLVELMEQLVVAVSGRGQGEFLRWVRVQNKDAVRLIPVDDVSYFRAEDKYTVLVTRDGESLIKKSIRELAGELDPHRFWQIHRGTIVNVSKIDRVHRSLSGRGVVKLKDREESLTVSRSYLHLFKQM